MKSLSMIAIACTVAGLASACSVRTETVERPAPVATTTVATPAPGTVVYTDPAPVASTTTVYTR
jgi:hypothetical protein